MIDGTPDPNAFVQELLELYEQSKELDNQKEPTFLSVIQKDYYENYLSRLIAYALLKDDNFIKALLNKYGVKKANISERKVSCEKNMDGRRADIFVELKNANPKITVTIENKTNTEEHDDQTQFYYNWVTEHFKGYKNYFFYLCPNYNISEAGCKDYVNLTYGELAAMIPKESNDPIVKDLRKHIEQKLGVRNMGLDDYVIKIIKNYYTFQKIISESKSAIKAYQIEAIEAIKRKLKERFKYEFIEYKKYDSEQSGDKTLLLEIVKSDDVISSYRFYKRDWYQKNQYYFYVEILFHYKTKDDKDSYGDLRRIKYQQTLKTYSDEGINKKLSDRLFDYTIKDNMFYVLESEGADYTFKGVDWDPQKWKADFTAKAPDILHKYIEAQEFRVHELFPDQGRTSSIIK